MAAINEEIKTSRSLTPLWVISLFVSLSEATLGVAVTQTTGLIQATLTIFVVLFPVLIAAGFFAVLWQKPYAFYPPSEYGGHVNVEQYIQAMRGAAGPIVKETKDVQDESLEAVSKMPDRRFGGRRSWAKAMTFLFLRPLLEIFGNPDRLTLLFKVKSSTWIRSTKAMQAYGGCIVQFSTKSLMPDGSWNVAEAATYVPGVTIQNEPEGEGKFLAPLNNDTR